VTVRVFAITSGVTAEDLRLAMGSLFAPAGPLNARTGVLPNAGVPADLTSAAALQANVAPFQAWIDGTSNALQGGYLFTSDANALLTFGAGNGTNPRIDLVVARIRDNPYDASGAQSGTVEVVAGTPAASPAAPAVPTSSIPLWQVLVPANASGGNPINFASARTDRRVFTALSGAPIPVASITERNGVAFPYAGMAVYRTDTKWVERHDGTAWRVEGVAAVAAFANLATEITNPRDGQLAVTTTDNRAWQYDAGGAAWIPAGPRGVVGVIKSNLNSNSTPVTAETLLLPLTFTAEAGRTYRVYASGGIVDGPAAGGANAAILLMRQAAGATVTTAGAVIGRTQAAVPASGSPNEENGIPGFEGWIVGAAAGNVTVGVFIQSANGTNTVAVFSTSTSGLTLSVEDVGPTIAIAGQALP
jgi:hypothetical protein